MAAAFAELGGYFDAKAAFFDPDEARKAECRDTGPNAYHGDHSCGKDVTMPGQPGGWLRRL